MKKQLQFGIGVVKPGKRNIIRPVIKATDKAWRTAIFGIGGSSKRIAGARIGTVDNQPLAVIAELQSEVSPDAPVWTIQTDSGLYAFAGPGAVYNDAGYGPATIGISRDRLAEIVGFDPDPEELQAGLRATIQARTPKNDEPA